MDATQAVDLARESIMLLLVISAPVLLVGMGVGLLISVIQAVTQVQEQTLSFVPKIVAMLLAALLTAPWACAKLMEFSRDMFGSLP
jgi:flagellar biosynthesis protein FliQ